MLHWSIEIEMAVCSIKTSSDMTAVVVSYVLLVLLPFSLIMYQKLAKGYIVVYSEN